MVTALQRYNSMKEIQRRINRRTSMTVSAGFFGPTNFNDTAMNGSGLGKSQYPTNSRSGLPVTRAIKRTRDMVDDGDENEAKGVRGTKCIEYQAGLMAARMKYSDVSGMNAEM